MEEKIKNNQKLNSRSKSPIIMSSKSKMASLHCNMHSTPKIHGLNKITKKNQEIVALPVNTTNVHPSKTLKKLNSCNNLQSTPNTQHLNKSDMNYRIIMNLSPILSTSSEKTNLKCYKENQHKLLAKNEFSLDNLNNEDSSSICNAHEIIERLKTNEMAKEIQNEKAKRCLFEKENRNSTSNLDTEQDSLNISLNLFEQLCHVSDMIDDNSAEEIQMSPNTDNKKNKLAFFLYGNNSTQLDDTKEENELLQLALSMEENLLNETKSKNKLCFEEKFTSLNQLNEKQTTLSENNELNDCINYSKCNVLDPLEINDFGNTQMCEIVDLTERLESFNDQWTQQCTINISNLCDEKKENQFSCDLINSNQIISDAQIKSYNCNKVSIENNDLLNNEAGAELKIVQFMLKDELNESTSPKDKSITNPNISKGFSTAGGKSINVSEKALQKVQLILKNEVNESSIVPNDKSITIPNITKGFSTAGGKSINVSDKALQKVQLMLKDELNESSTVSKDKSITNSNITKEFSTAGGKSISVSDKALQKVQLMLKDELNESSTVSKDKSINSNICKGFSTAGGKSISVSDKALQKVQLMLKDELNESSTVSKNKSITNSNICKGVSTAGGKSINVSEKALQKVQSILKDEVNESSTVPNDKFITIPNITKGFSTAGGKSISVSDKVLQKVQLMLKDELNESSIVSKDKSFTNSNISKGFSTAGGKSISVSEKALQKVQLMLKDELNESSTVSKNKSITNSNICKGFSTAGGKSINVSEKALQKVQLILKDEVNESCIVPNDKSITIPNISKGFSTAGGKSISVSDIALQKVHLILKDEMNESSTVPNDKSITIPSISKGFSVSGNKSISVSDKALQKVQLILKDDVNDCYTVSKDKSITNLHISKGISTADGNSINVLDELLKKEQSKNKDDVNEVQFNNSLETIYISCKNSNERLITTNSVNPNSKPTIFDVATFEEERTLEDLSLIDTVNRFERDENIYKLIMKNKRPGSPLNKTNHKTRKTVHDEGWENDVLKVSFGVYLSKKLNGPKVSLPKTVNWILPKICNIKQFPDNGKKYEFTKLNVDNALHLKLHWKKYNDNINKLYNFQDIKNLFLSHHFVDGNLIPNGWIENHFRLIVWKLAATEISFSDHFEHKLLTAKNVIHQLLYRYYREIEKCQRSALKKILEKDETASKRIILCVSKVIKTNIAEVYNIELTDGWYRVQGLIDFEMNMLLHKGIVKVGTKLMIHNAELIGAGEGIDPLNVHDGVKLKISTNSTRRVRWYAKLGFYVNSSLPIPISLESVLPCGGIIGSLSLVILRKYHMMYLERRRNLKSILRNEKMEDIETEKYKAYKQKLLENISNQVETELIAEMASTTKKSKIVSNIKKEQLDKLSIDELSNYMDNYSDPSEIQSILGEDKLEALKSFKKSEHDKFYNELHNRVDKILKKQDTRKVTPLLKLRVVDEKHAATGFKAAILTIWNPSEDISAILKESSEGQCCKVHYLNTNGFINGVLQISTNKNTRFDFQGFKNKYAKRNAVSFKSIWSGTFLPLFGELDLVSIVISNVNKSNHTYNEIYVSDKEMNIISILFKGDIKDYGYDDIMYPGSIISGVNVQFRGFNKISSVPKLFNTELSSFTTFPRAKHLLNVFDEYKTFLKRPENQDFINCCQSRLHEICNKNTEITTNIEDIKPQSLNTSINVQNKSYGKLPVTIVKTSNTSQSEYSPVQKRLKLLNTYGKTPPLNIVHTKPPEKKLLSKFKTPTRL